jgi:hypothetical protein
VIADHPKLTSMAGVRNIASALSYTITNNSALTDANLEQLKSVENLTLAVNNGLKHFSADKLETAIGLILTSNPQLESISLKRLKTAQSLSIAANDSLTSVGTLAAFTSGAGLVIASNPALPQCAVDVIAARVECGSCGGNNTAATCQ